MLKIDEILKKNSLVANRYIKKNNVYFIDTKDTRYVVKKNKYSTDIYNSNPKINEELVNKEKEKIYAKKWFSSIDID